MLTGLGQRSPAGEGASCSSDGARPENREDRCLTSTAPLRKPSRQQLQLRDPLHPRARQDEDPCRPGAGGDDGAGPWAGAGRPRGADALAGRRGALPRHRLTLCLTSDIAARPSCLPAEGKPRPFAPSCSRSVLVSRQIAAICSPGGDQAVDIRSPKISVVLSKNATAHTPPLTCLACRQSIWYVRARSGEAGKMIQSLGERAVP